MTYENKIFTIIISNKYIYYDIKYIQGTVEIPPTF